MVSDPFPDVPDPDFGGEAARPSRASHRRSREDAAVRKICTLARLPRMPALLAAEAEARTGSPSCTFPLFDEFTGFPVRFRVGRLRGVRFLAVPDLFNRFAKTAIGLALADVCDEADPAEGPVALVFRWPGRRDESGRLQSIKGALYMTAHTASTSFAGAGVKIVASMRLGGARHVVTVEPLDALMLNFSDWSPTG
jgi:hypothetical protein